MHQDINSDLSFFAVLGSFFQPGEFLGGPSRGQRAPLVGLAFCPGDVVKSTRKMVTLTLNSFTIDRTMARDHDTDWVYLAAKVGENVYGPRHEKLGDFDNTTCMLDWTLGPFTIEQDTPWLFTYQIVNRGNGDAQQQLQDDGDIVNAVVEGLGTVITFAAPEAAPVVAVIQEAIDKVGAALQWISGQVNCDGMVLSDAITSSSFPTESLWSSVTSHTEERSYDGPNTPTGCGRNARYKVKWTLTVA